MYFMKVAKSIRYISQILISLFVISLLLPFFIFLNIGEYSNNEFCNGVLPLQISDEATFEYQSIPIYPETQNILCLGKIIGVESSVNTVQKVFLGYNYDLISLYLNLTIVGFFMLPFFKQYINKIYVPIQIFFHIFYLFFIYFIFYKTGFYDIYVPKFDPSIFILLPFLLNLKFNNDDVVGMLSQFIFFCLFATKFFGIIVLFIFFYKKEIFINKFMKYKLFYYLPFIKLFLIWVSSISANLNFLWLTLIERPHAGLTRFYDLQWNLVSLMCKKNPRFETATLFEVDGVRACPLEMYSPLYNILSIEFNVYFAYIFITAIWFVLIYMLFQKYSVNKSSYSYLLILLLISPPMNFLIYQGNVDILVLITLSSLLVINFPYFLKIILIAFISLLEIHPVPFLIGVLFHNLIFKNFKKLVINISVFFIVFLVLLQDSSSQSIRNWSKNMGHQNFRDTDFVFGLTTDLSVLFNVDLSPYLVAALYLPVIITFIYFSRNKEFLAIKFNQNLTSELFFGFTAWFSLVVLYENFSYRLAGFLFFIF